MKVAFGLDALGSPEVFRHLTAIWWLTIDGLHRWVVPDELAVRRSRWVEAEGRQMAGEIRQSARLAGRRQDVPDVVIEKVATPHFDGRTWHVPAPRALRWLRKPLKVLVENAKVDGGFLRLVTLRVGEKTLRRRLGDDGYEQLRARWTSALGDEERVVVVHGGGNTLSQQVELAVEASDDLPPRVFVLVDSDRKGPDAAVGSTAGQVRELAKRLPDFGVGWKVVPFVLEKREVENYLPHDALWAVVGRRPIPDADFGNIKKVMEDDGIARKVLERADVHLHARALRERCGDDGRELDKLIGCLIDQL